jgi:hypothetical protein
MNLNKALIALADGQKIKLPEWKGYWELSSYEDKLSSYEDIGLIEVHKANGEVVNTPDFEQYGGREDWEVVQE